jgi:hypothetical protein
MDGSVARMSNADRIRSRLGLPMSDGLVVAWPVELQATATSSQPSLPHQGSVVIADGTHSKAQFPEIRIMSPQQLPRHPLQKHNAYYPRYYENTPIDWSRYKKHCLQKHTPTGTSRHTAPNRASGRSRPPLTKTKPMSHRAWSCAANTRNQALQTQIFFLRLAHHSLQVLFLLPYRSECLRLLTSGNVTCPIARSARAPIPRLTS